MALAIDGSTPAVATNAVATTATVTTASFTPPSGALLLILWAGNTGTASAPGAPSITDNLGVHLTYAQVDWRSLVDTPGGIDGQCAIWTAVVGTSAAMTVTVTSGSASGVRESALKVVVITGQHATPTGAHGKSGSTSAASISQNFTGTASGSWGFLAVCDWDLKGAETAGTGNTIINSANVASAITYGFDRRTTADGTNGGTTTLAVTIPTTSTNLSWCYVEVIPAATAAAVTFTPDRQAPYSDRRWTPQQRPYASPPDLLATALLEVPGARPSLAAVTHQRQSWLRAAPTLADQSSVAPLLLDPTLAGPGSVARGLPATHVDRRLVPVQRPYVSAPDLLGTALLEVAPARQPQLTPRDPGETYWTQPARRDLPAAGVAADPTQAGTLTARLAPSTHADRREVPTQRSYPAPPDPVSVVGTGALGAWWSDDPTVAYLAARPRVSDPALLTPAGSSWDPLLAGAGIQMVARTPATHTDRRVVTQQPARRSVADEITALIGTGASNGWWSIDDTAHFGPAQRTRRLDLSYLIPASVPADPTQSGYLPGWLTRNTPATHDDRRLYPAQHTALALPDDVQLVGTGALVAWWGADDSAIWAWASLPGPPDPNLLTPPVAADPTLLGWLPNWTTHNEAATHSDRRLVPQQRAYLSDPSFYPTIPPTDPLTLAWGAGGTYWVLYNTAALNVSRRLVPQQRTYLSDPGLLSTALLEGAVLGAADDQARHRTVLTDRRWMPAPRVLVSDPRLLVVTDPTTVAAGVGGDLWRRINTPATNGPRWVLRTWRQALEFMGTPPIGAIDGFARPGDGRTLRAGPGAGAPSADARPGGGSTTKATGG